MSWSFFPFVFINQKREVSEKCSHDSSLRNQFIWQNYSLLSIICRLSKEYGMWSAGFPEGHSLLQAGERPLWIMGYADGPWLWGGPPGLHITHNYVLNEFPEKQIPLLLNESDESWFFFDVVATEINKSSDLGGRHSVVSRLVQDRGSGQGFRSVMLLTSHLWNIGHFMLDWKF